MIRFHDLRPDFALTVRPAPDLDERIEARVRACWSEARANAPRLFDDPLLSLVDHDPSRLTACVSSYRYLVAQRRDPSLRGALSLRPLAVTGVLRCADGLVLARRAAHVTTDPGLWEPAPSGGLDRDDPVGQLLEELREELGLAPDDVGPPRAVVLMETPRDATFDIVYELVTPRAGAEVRAAWTSSGSDEYADVAVLPPGDLRAFVGREAARLASVTLPLLRRLGWLG